MADDLNYKCPHCHATVRVADAMIGEQINCPECDRQFEAHAPVAWPVDGEQSGKASREDPVTRSADDERVLREVHPVVLRNHVFLSCLFLLLGLAGVMALAFGFSGSVLLGLEGTLLIIPGGVLIAASVVYFAYRWWQAISMTLRVTTQRTIAISGVVSKATNEVQHDDVRNIKSDRNVLERLLNYGDIALSSSGQDDMEIVVHDVPDPQGIIRIIRSHQ